MNQNSPIGKVYLVGAGPGDPGLLTVKGKILLEMADVVVYDALVSEEILAMANVKAEKINAGKRKGRHSLLQSQTTQLLIEKARQWAIVVRLKGGDPFVFGRGGEEMADLLAAGIPVEVVPGVTSGIAAPAYANIPVTHRHYSSSVTFITGHEATEKYRPEVNWSAIAQGSETIVIYMGIHNLAQIIPQLKRGGLTGETKIALIRWGTTAKQEELYGTLDNILTKIVEQNFQAPAIAVIGKVIQFRELIQGTGVEPV